jgi:proline dehydrogenase
VKLLDRVMIGVLPLVPKPVVGVFSRRYIAGRTVEDALREARALNAAGCRVTLDILGEQIRSREEALQARDAYLGLLEALHGAGVDGNVSLKPTQFGLAFDRDYAAANIRAVVARAGELGGFVRIDMEDSPTTDATLEVYRTLRRDHGNLGVVLQACLRRTAADAEALAATKANVRLCKGIYVEPFRISWRDREIVRRNFLHALEILLRGGSYVGIATHDEFLVWGAQRLIHDLRLPPSAYEFQMLLGVTPRLREVIVAAGHPMRVYVPFGEQWYAYSTRRLRENPALAGTIAMDVLGLSSDRRRR